MPPKLNADSLEAREASPLATVGPLPSDTRQRRRKPYLFVLCLLVGVVLHAPLLRAVYATLVVDEPLAQCEVAVLLKAAPECCDRSAELLRDGTVTAVALVDYRPRSVRIGAANSCGEIALRHLTSRGVPETSVRVVPTHAATSHEQIRQFDAYLSQTPQVSCVLVVTSTMSRYYRQVVDGALSEDRASRYRLHAVSPVSTEGSQHSDAWRWYRSRSGIKRVVNHGLRLAFVVFHDESHVDPSYEDRWEELIH